jgi:hypothetical protein
VVLTLGAGGAAWWYRAGYWSAVRQHARGDVALAKLRSIGEKHAIDLGETPAGKEAVAVWRRTSEQGRLLKPDFTAAAEASRRLAATESGRVKFRAELDAKFYDLCTEWVDLYDRVYTQITTQSIDEPPIEWALENDDIIMRIQALIEPESGGQDGEPEHDHERAPEEEP